MGCACSTPELTNDDKLSRTYKRARLAQNLVQQTNKVDPLTRYEVVKRLGVGSMGYVSAAKRKGSADTDHLYAMKTIRPGAFSLENRGELVAAFIVSAHGVLLSHVGRLTREFIAELKNEIRAIRRLDHPSIVRFHEVYYDKQISIIMDMCSGGDVYERMPYAETQAGAIMKQVLDALAYMHRKGYVHLDIKVSSGSVAT